jgi:hypothetical protein
MQSLSLVRVEREGKVKFTVDSKRGADIVESPVCPDSREKNSLKIGESTSFHAW